MSSPHTDVVDDTAVDQTPETAPTRKRAVRLPSFSVQIIASLFIGVALGWLALVIGPNPAGEDNPLTVTLDTIGTIFVTLLRAVIPPLIITAVIQSIANLDGVKNAARLAVRTLIWFAITALLTVVLGIILGLVFHPGTLTGLGDSTGSTPSRVGSWLDFINGFVPANFLALTASSSVSDSGSVSTSVNFRILQVIVIAFAIGIAALKVGKAAQPFLDVNRALLEIVQKIIWWIIRLAPLGTIGLIGRAVATYGWTSLSSLGVYTITIYVGLAIMLFALYPILLKIHGLAVRPFLKGAWPAIQLAFVSRSSVATMPLTERVTSESLGVPKSYASFAVPFGAAVKMDACTALYPAVSAIFVAQFFGIHLTIGHYLLIAAIAVLGSAATAGVSGAVVMLTLVLSTLGLPLEGVGLLVSIDPILDMGRTAVNVAGQALVPVIVSKREGILDIETYESARSLNLS